MKSNTPNENQKPSPRKEIRLQPESRTSKNNDGITLNHTRLGERKATTSATFSHFAENWELSAYIKKKYVTSSFSARNLSAAPDPSQQVSRGSIIVCLYFTSTRDGRSRRLARDEVVTRGKRNAAWSRRAWLEVLQEVRNSGLKVIHKI